jgi:hypothetical protein
MPQVKDVLKHVLVETAGARRKCYHKPKLHTINKGEYCLVVNDVSGRVKRSYCASCAEEIVKLSESRISDIKQALRIS